MDIFNITDMFTRANPGYGEILLRDHQKTRHMGGFVARWG